MIDFSLWYMFLVAIGISTIAMMSGIGGALLFSPVFMLVLGLSPKNAIATGLVIEIFGFSSGVIGYLKQKTVNFEIVKKLLIWILPFTIMGVLIGKFVNAVFLKVLLINMLFYLSYQFLIQNKKCEAKHPSITKNHNKVETIKIDSSIKYTSSLGGLLLGMISSGLGVPWICHKYR